MPKGAKNLAFIELANLLGFYDYGKYTNYLSNRLTFNVIWEMEYLQIIDNTQIIFALKHRTTSSLTTA